MQLKSFDVIKEALALSGEPDQLILFYRKWASTYDKDVSNEQYCAPEFIADYFSEICDQTRIGKPEPPESIIDILDAGCGTGLVGLALQQKGYSTIDGCDLSHEMIELAKQTGSYRSLFGDADLNNLTTFKDNQYDAVVCCGVFTHGHIPPVALEELVRVTRKSGIIVISVRKSFYKSTDFQAVFDRLEKAGQIKKVSQIIGPYILEEGAYYLGFQVCKYCL